MGQCEPAHSKTDARAGEDTRPMPQNGHVVVAVAQPPHGSHRRYGGGSGGRRTCGLSTGRGCQQLLLVLTVAVVACGLPRVSHAWWSQNWACSGGCDYNGNCKSSSSSRFSGTSSCPSGYTDGSSNWYWSGTCSYTGCYYICSDECSSGNYYTGEYSGSDCRWWGQSKCKCCPRTYYVDCKQWLRCTWVPDPSPPPPPPPSPPPPGDRGGCIYDNYNAYVGSSQVDFSCTVSSPRAIDVSARTTSNDDLAIFVRVGSCGGSIVSSASTSRTPSLSYGSASYNTYCVSIVCKNWVWSCGYATVSINYVQPRSPPPPPPPRLPPPPPPGDRGGCTYDNYFVPSINYFGQRDFTCDVNGAKALDVSARSSTNDNLSIKVRSGTSCSGSALGSTSKSPNPTLAYGISSSATYCVSIVCENLLSGCSGAWVSINYGTPPVRSPPPGALSSGRSLAKYWSTNPSDARNAYLAALLSSLAYNDSAAFCSKAAAWGVSGACQLVYGSLGTQYGLLDLGTSCILAFRGTESRGDKVVDFAALAISPIPVRGVSGLAAGFAVAAYNNYDDVISRLQSSSFRASKSKPVWVMGHSLGGALSLITAQWLQSSGLFNVAGVYTFGAPPAGNILYFSAYSLKSKTYSYAYKKLPACGVLDVVADLDETALLGYMHAVPLTPVYDSSCASSSGRRLLTAAAPPAPAPASALSTSNSTPTTATATVTAPDAGQDATAAATDATAAAAAGAEADQRNSSSSSSPVKTGMEALASAVDATEAPTSRAPSAAGGPSVAIAGTRTAQDSSNAEPPGPQAVTSPPSCLVSVRYAPQNTMVRGRGNAPPPAEIGTLSPALPQHTSLEDGIFTSVTSEVMLSTADGASKAYTRTVQVSDVRTCSTAGWPAGLWAELTGMGIDLLELGLEEPPMPSPPPPGAEAISTAAVATRAAAAAATDVCQQPGCVLCHSIEDFYVPGLWNCLSSTDKARLPLPTDLKA